MILVPELEKDYSIPSFLYYFKTCCYVDENINQNINSEGTSWLPAYRLQAIGKKFRTFPSKSCNLFLQEIEPFFLWFLLIVRSWFWSMQIHFTDTRLGFVGVNSRHQNWNSIKIEVTSKLKLLLAKYRSRKLQNCQLKLWETYFFCKFTFN